MYVHHCRTDVDAQPWVHGGGSRKGKERNCEQDGVVVRWGQIRQTSLEARINTNLVMLGIGTITIYEWIAKGASIASSLHVFGPC